MRPFAIILGLLLLAPLASAQVPAVPPYETNLFGYLQTPYEFAPGVAVSVPLEFHLQVWGQVQHGEVKVRASAPVLPGWNITITPAEVTVTLDGAGDPTLNTYDGRFSALIVPDANAPAEPFTTGYVTLQADATTFTRAAEGGGAFELRITPITRMLVVGGGETVTATLGVPAQASLRLRNDGNTELTLQLTGSIFPNECEVIQPAERVMAPQTEEEFVFSITCLHAPTFDDPQLAIEIQGRGRDSFSRVWETTTIPLRIVDKDGEIIQGSKLDLPLGWSAPIIAMALVALARRGVLPPARR